jgi:pyruvate dehydrogenase E2 component (dihydrolipoamide acetyltransferase)
MDVGDGLVTTLADRVAALLDQRHMRDVHLIGHSLGGGIAIMLAETRPDLVASLTLIAPAGLGQGIDPSFLSDFPNLSNPEETGDLLRRLVVRPRLISRPLVGHVLEQLRRPGARQALRLIGEGIAKSIFNLEAAADSAARRGIPRLVVWGDSDLINPASQEKMRDFGGDAAIIVGAGHLPHVENPRAVNTSIANFLTRVSASGC